MAIKVAIGQCVFERVG